MEQHTPPRKLRGHAAAPGTNLPAGRAPAATPRVLLAGGLLAMDAPGGGEIQMHSIARALQDAGSDVRLWRPWEDRLEDCQLLHLFGSAAEHLPVIAAARRRGIPVALSPIAWFSFGQYWRERRWVGRRAAGCAALAVRRAWPRLPSWRRRLYDAADLLMPNSQAEARQLIQYYGVPAAKIHVVPNGAQRRFAAADAGAFVRRFGLRDFVLYAGRIEPRKNQLVFLEAIAGLNVPVVILGDVVPGCEDYLRRCRAAAGPQVRFLGRLEHDDPSLASAYAAAGCLVLASWYETPGLVALEAAMTGTPLVLPAPGCAREYFGDRANYVAPTDRPGIRRAVQAALRRGRSPALADMVAETFSWDTAGRVTLAGYQKLLGEST